MQSGCEVGREDFVFSKLVRGFPKCAKATYQAGDPIGGLHGLVAVTFQLKGRLNKASSSIGPIHGDRRLCNESRPLVVFVEGEEEPFARRAIYVTMLINALDRFTQNMSIESV